jgi:hypothetical protein
MEEMVHLGPTLLPGGLAIGWLAEAISGAGGCGLVVDLLAAGGHP